MDPLHSCHSPLLRSGRVRLWFQFWSQSFQSRCQEANQHFVVRVPKLVKNLKKFYRTCWKTSTLFRFKKSAFIPFNVFEESLPRHFERLSLTEADFNLCQLRICFGSFLGEFGSLQSARKQQKNQHLSNSVLVNLLHMDVVMFMAGKPVLRSWINLFWGALLLRYHDGWDKFHAYFSPSNKQIHFLDKLGMVVYKTIQWHLHCRFLLDMG